MMSNSVLSAFSFNLQLFIQRETSWRQSLSFLGSDMYLVWSKKHRCVCHLHKGDDPGCDSG